MPPIDQARSIYALFARGADAGQWVVLTAVRMFWGYQFAITGWGKMGNIEGVTGYFESLSIPMPALNAYVVSGTELFGGLALLFGLGARVASVPLTIAMTVAYLTADWEAGAQIFSDPDAFVSAAPFLFLLASLLSLTFGSGPVSADAIVARVMAKEGDVESA